DGLDAHPRLARQPPAPQAVAVGPSVGDQRVGRRLSPDGPRAMSGWAMAGPVVLLGAATACVVTMRVAAQRGQALSGPLRELRGALAAIQLGLFAMERRGPSAFGSDRIDALRTQAERAHVAVEDVDDIRLGRSAPTSRREIVEVGAIVQR